MSHTSPIAKVLLTPFQSFAKSESAGGLLLIAAAVLAMVWANTPWASTYFHVKEIHAGLHWGSWGMDKSLEWWVNDGLMAIFFLFVGLEIKREVLIGELAGVRRAMWPAVAAVGGMVIPAAIYAVINWNHPTLRGWGIPMATDIAFALGVMSLLGKRVPIALKVFLTALAIVDDLGAVLVIAVFYTDKLDLTSLAIVAGLLLLCVLYAKVHGRRLWIFASLGAVMWYFMYQSGIHPTVAGVLLALTIPIGPTTRTLPKAELRRDKNEFEQMEAELQQAEDELEQLQSPLYRLEHGLSPWVGFAIMPLFALFNAGISLTSGMATLSPVAMGIFLGLLLGKPIGIVGASWIASQMKLIDLPKGVTWTGMIGAGLLGGIGFTMSLFIAMLAFAGQEGILDQAKLAILLTSVIAAVIGMLLLLAGKPAGRPI